ncbi:MAG: hypothetical protein G01um101466_520 [Parcubacteria group bacterium Gr01-1014_66]|nr:MAG: hypothetical protein G01um101466_520 [Parcubacteria group bacterium Gr01-1014_66]
MHSEVLTDNGRKIFSRLSSFSGFYLAGGTALAMQIGHRQSFDFDLFQDTEIPDNLLIKTKRVFTEFSKIIPLVNNPDELTISIENTKVTFLWYPFPVLTDFITGEHIPLLSISEIAVTKAYTIGRRGSYKDYVDLYFILKEHHASLTEIIDLAKRKYQDEFNARLFLEQLTYLDDIHDTEILFLKQPINKDQLTLFFQDVIRKFEL